MAHSQNSLGAVAMTQATLKTVRIQLVPLSDDHGLPPRSWSCGWPFAAFQAIRSNHNSKIAGKREER